MSFFFRRFTSNREDPGIKLIVFDFDGTLADTRELFIRIIKRHLLRFEISLTKDLLRFFGNTPLEDYISMTGIPADLVRSVCIGIHNDFSEEYHKIKPCKNLMVVKTLDVKKIIVSNNITSFVEKSLNFLKANFFTEVHGADHFKNKVIMINSLLKKYRLSSSEIIYVGDKDVDVDVARAVGCSSVVIAGKASWSTRKDILVKKPDYVLTDLGKLPHVFAELNAEQLPAV